MTDEVTDVTVTEDVTPVEQTTEVESSTNEQAAEQVTEEASEETEQGQADEPETEASDSEETLAPKSQNRFQKLANENRELRTKIAQLEQVQVPTEQDYLDGGYDPIEAKVNAMQAEMQRDRQVNEITNLNKDIDNDMARIIHEYPQLDPKSPQFNKNLAVKLFDQYDKDSGAQYADDGIVLAANQLPHEYIKNKMELIGIASQQAQVKAQKSVEKMVAASETPTGKVAPKATGEMSTREMEESLGIIYQ
jgi:predicted RNase H-like nuclease (RuvC/YqgF family)